MFGLHIDNEELYYGRGSVARRILDQSKLSAPDSQFVHVAPTKSLLLVVTLVERCLANREPVLLVGGA